MTQWHNWFLEWKYLSHRGNAVSGDAIISSFTELLFPVAEHTHRYFWFLFRFVSALHIQLCALFAVLNDFIKMTEHFVLSYSYFIAHFGSCIF